MKNTINDKVKDIMSIVLEISKKNIGEDTSVSNVSAWDSLKHMNLIVALEEAFEIEFDEVQLVEINNYKKIVEVISLLI